MDSIKTGDTIGIILCTYNGEKFIREQLDSIFSQTDTNWHLIASDDSSSDGTVAILREYRERHPEAMDIIARTEGTGNASVHFLKMIYAQSPNYRYMMCADQDDLWYPHKIETMRGLMKKAERRYGADMPLLLYSDSKTVDTSLNPIAPSTMRYMGLSPKYNTLNHLLIQNTVTGASMMMNRELTSLLKNVPYHATMHDTWMALIASCFGRILYTDRQLYMYRQHEGSVLGAQKQGMATELMQKLSKLKAGSTGEYASIYNQAEEFLADYGGQLTDSQREVVTALVDMRHMNRIDKIKTLVHYNLTYSKTYRTMGECLYI